MKIIDVICSKGRTGFYFDDQRAIKKGAGHDGVFYVGEPVTEGFSRVRQAGESISVMLILEDGQIAGGVYAGGGGSVPRPQGRSPLISVCLRGSPCRWRTHRR